MIETRDVPEKDLRINTVRGVTTRDEFLEAVADFYKGKPFKNLLWNFREADASSIQASDIQAIVGAMRKLTHSREGGRSAIVATADLDYGLARMFEILSGQEKLEFEVGAFRDLDEAMEWIGANDRPDS